MLECALRLVHLSIYYYKFTVVPYGTRTRSSRGLVHAGWNPLRRSAFPAAIHFSAVAVTVPVHVVFGSQRQMLLALLLPVAKVFLMS